jgi:DNA-binding transcriptional LysR family regulator
MDRLAAMATFVRVVEQGSLSAAARSLPSSLTAVSRQISALEERLGTRLLLRTTRHLALTDDGRLFYERAKAILGEISEVEAALSRERDQPAGRIRISAPTLMGRQLLAPLLAEFLRRHPSLSVDLLLVDREVDMIEEDVQLALRIGHLADSAIVARKLGTVQMVVCGSPAYLARRGTPSVPGDLAHHDCLLFSETPGVAEWRFADGTKSGRKIRMAGRLWVNSLEALVTAARDGAGLARAPSWQVARDLAAGSLARLLAEYERPPAPLHLLFQPSRPASRKTRAFVDYLAAQWRNASPFGNANEPIAITE